MARRLGKIDVWDVQETQPVEMSEYFHVVYHSKCEIGHFLSATEKQDEFRILTNGSLFFPNEEREEYNMIGVDHFCLLPHQNGTLSVIICSELEEPLSDGAESWTLIVYRIFFVISAIFLLLTIAALCLTQELRSVHVRSVLCQSGSLLLTFVGLTVISITGDTVHIYICKITCFITHYFFLASFFWLNVMCIDIYITFKGFGKRINKQFQNFSVYAWCTPFIISAITITLDHFTNHEIFSPGVGETYCWFNNFWSQLIYFHGPVLILLLINCFLFLVTAVRLCRAKRDASRVLHGEGCSVHCGNAKKQQQQDKEHLKLFFKLFLLMGCTWILEFVSLAVGGPSEIWYFTDAVNCLRGVLIFWLCVWSNKNTRDQLKQWFCSARQTVRVN
ncbi:G-protein coupled receptor Mth2-like [Cloeon dipterum]|uniref:G-protein coupled receptor Mth2-like n=1 Tax=Cloeon dipterum TaxID=197152 RepID=UPI00321F8B64